MDIYEFQGKELFRQAGIPVSEGRLVLTPQEARDAAAELGCPVVVKAQVLTGGRGKAGGVKLAVSPADAEEKAKTSAILGALTGGLAGGAEAAQRGALQTEMLAGQAVADTRRAGGTDAGVTRALTQEQLDEAMGLLGYIPGSY